MFGSPASRTTRNFSIVKDGNNARLARDKINDFVSVKDFGATGLGVKSDLAAFNRVTQIGAIIPPGTYKTDSAPTGATDTVIFGAQFNGTTPYNTWMPPFGQNAFTVISTSGRNSLIGAMRNTRPASTLAFPTGVTAYGRTDNAGNQAFALYCQADLYNTGVATTEIDAFNYSGSAASSQLPPDRSIGTAQFHAIGITLAAGGTNNCSIGMHVGREGSTNKQWLTGIYLDQSACVTYGLYIDALSSSTNTSIVAKHAVAQTALNIIGVGTPAAGNAWFTYTDGAAVIKFAVRQDGRLYFTSGITQSTHGAAGAAAALPANPTGYAKFEIDGNIKIFPYYEP